MKIDIHTHTKKIKSGDSPLRNIDAIKFNEIIRETDVKILAITNHNHFDFDQFQVFKNTCGETCQIWPGIELDILEEGKRAHLIAIVNPKNADKFNTAVQALLNDQSADSFTVGLAETVTSFDDLDTIYIAHYYAKKPDLPEEQVIRLTSLVSNPNRVIKEATNSISAGIYVSHGHKSIYGSDVHNWDHYLETAKNLPDLRLPVESFEQFCLLLEKMILK